MAPPAGVVARVLGDFEVLVDGRRLTRVDWQRVSAERLMKLLLVTPGHRLSRELAAEALWPGAGPETGRANLRKAIHFAHRALQEADPLGGDAGSVSVDPERLELDLDRLTAALDLVAAAETAGRAEHGRAPGGRDDDAGPSSMEVEAAIDVVLQLGSRPLLPEDAYDDWLTAPRERLQSRWQRVAMQAALRAHETGRTPQAHEILAQLLERDPTDEAAHRLAIDLYAADGRHHAARRQFELCRRALEECLDAEPSVETVEVFRAAERVAGRARGPVSRAARLVARQAELERVEPLMDRVIAGRLAALVIRGAAGVGKTRLLQEMADYGRAAGWQVLEWQAVESSRSLAYAPLRVGFAERLTPADAAGWEEPARSALATVLPGIVESSVAFEDGTALAAALVAAVARLSRVGPLFVAIDDLPWLDPATLEVLRGVVSGLAAAPILVASTYRDDEPVGDAIQSFLDQVRRAGGLELALGPLALRDVEPLVLAHLGGGSVQPELSRLLFRESAGNPLFCLELVRAGRDHGTIQLRDARWTLASNGLETELPDSVRRLVVGRSAGLPAPALELLATAAELGPEIEFATLSVVLPDLPGGLVSALDAALASGLLTERRGGYTFAHPLYRLAVADVAGSARRGAIGLAIARALAGPALEGVGAVALAHLADACVDPVPVAEHALAAAELGVVEALPMATAFGFAAGARSRRLFDLPGATRLLERSLATWRRLPPNEARSFAASAAWLDLLAIRMAAGDDAAATASFREAVTTARGPDELAEAYVVFHELPYRHGDFEGALALLEEALGRLPADAAVPRARIEAYAGWCLVRLRRLGDARRLLEGSLAVLGSAGDRRGTMRTLDQLGILLRYDGQPEEAIDRLERSLAIALELRDSRGEVLARAHLAVALTRSGHPAGARPHYERALELAALMGDRYAEAVTAWGAAEMEDALGDYRAAAELRRRELRLLASMGGNPHNEALAHAHLAHLARLAGEGRTSEDEATAARRLAQRSPDPGYPARIEQALAVERWSELET